MIGPETRLEDIDFPARARHALRREGVETVGTLLSVDRDWLGALKGVGKKAMQFVRDLEAENHDIHLEPGADAVVDAAEEDPGCEEDNMHRLRKLVFGSRRHELLVSASEILGFTCRNRIPDVNSARESVRIAAAMRDEAARLAGTAASLDVNRVVDFRGASYLVLPYRKNDDYPPEAVHLVLVPQVDP